MVRGANHGTENVLEVIIGQCAEYNDLGIGRELQLLRIKC
jgi:hypothetical protein